MKKEKQLTEADYKKVDEFNSFMLDKWVFILVDWQVTMNPNKVMIWNYEYTMQQALKDFKNK